MEVLIFGRQKNHFMDILLYPANASRAQFAITSGLANCAFFCGLGGCVYPANWVGLPQPAGRQSEFNRQWGLTGNSSWKQ